MIKRLSKLKISALFSLSILIFSSVFMFFQILVVFSYNSLFLEDKLTQSSKHLAHQIGLRIDDVILSIEEVAINIRLSQQVVDLYQIDNSSSFDQLSLLYDSNKVFSAIAHSDENILGIYLLTDKLDLYSEQPANGIYDITRLYDTPIYEALSNERSGFISTQNDYFSQNVFESNPRNTFYYFRTITDSPSEGHTAVLILIDEANFNESYLTPQADGGEIFLFSENGDIISPYDDSQESLQSKQTMFDEIATSTGDGNESLRLNYDNKPYVGTAYTLKNNWELMYLYPYSEITDGVGAMRNMSFITSLSFFLFALLIAVVFTAAFRQPIKQLLQNINKLGADNLDVEFDVTLKNEIGDINRQLSKIMQRLKTNVTEIKDNQAKLIESECKALQSQINPHFLYNTLDAINWMAIRYKADDISNMSMHLGTFFRHTHNKDKTTTSVEKELEHLQAYVNIQTYRYDNRFTFSAELAPDILKCTIVNIVLQPLVENSLLHGAELTNGACNISIVGFSEENDVIIDVIDDGCGFDTEKMNEHLANDVSMTTGYGILNVHQRLKLHFGENYGLTYIKVEKGTHARIRIPNDTK